jgi:hypothetical protein
MRHLMAVLALLCSMVSTLTFAQSHPRPVSRIIDDNVKSVTIIYDDGTVRTTVLPEFCETKEITPDTITYRYEKVPCEGLHIRWRFWPMYTTVVIDKKTCMATRTYEDGTIESRMWPVCPPYEESVPKPSATLTLIGRTGLSRSGYNISEAYRTDAKGLWIWPDVGYLSFDRPGEYRELFMGFGRTIVANKRFAAVAEVYLFQATGPEAHSARYFQPWVFAIYHLTPSMSARVVYFPYLPLNSAATTQHVLEHVKVEKTLDHHFKVGVGYSGYKFGDSPWQNKPFITGTFSAKQVGSWEVWLQRLPGNHPQVQVRYEGMF